ncbi:tail fiber assembly protein [Pseudomonas aeruginosa]|uniref:tail fiber assembly protein n=1 Tax=Pseudomonas aeruginosa TaxID=287 RepID=UPI001ADFC66A|nr:tail fiber assembly protein [Pseudomonas aeruginosa]MDF1652600.1 tail fiber assembly protein [Pseudomonas aeruginosa]
MIKEFSYNGATYFNVPADGGGLGIPPDVLSAALLDQAWGLIRAERDRRIAATDYTQMPDSPLTAEQRQAFAAYRQALRDIPQDHDSPDAVAWPDVPALS